MGRELAEQRTTNSITKGTSYTYNLDGSLATLTYPSGLTITYTPDLAGRPSQAQDLVHNVNYVQGTCPSISGNTGVCYTPQGAVTELQGGVVSGTAAVTFTNAYNNRLQPSTFQFGFRHGGGYTLTYTFLDANSNNNGNVISIANSKDATRSQQFTYDQLNRLLTAETTSTFATSPTKCWGEQYGYDAWGNLLSNSAASSAYTGCTQESLSVLAAATNRVSTFCYDAAGNLLAQGSCSSPAYAYNAESQMTSTAGVTYLYDGDGNRVEKSNGKIYWYGGGGNALDESDLSGNMTDEYVFFGGNRIAHNVVSSGLTYYYAEDMLGTSRSIVTSSMGMLCHDADFYPFGGERVYTNTCDQNYKFTGKERDAESGLDYFEARHYASTLGRFMSVDPVIITPERKVDPQQLNRYAYVRNNPLRLVDPTGEILQLSGDLAADTATLCNIVGSGNCDRISINEQNNTVSFNTSGLDLSANEGATLVNQLVTSSNTYSFALSDTVNTAGGPVKLTNDPISNLDNQLDDRYSNGKTATDLPSKGVADQVTIDPKTAHFTDSQGRLVSLSSLAFHELAEAYGKIDGGKAYGDFQTVNVMNGTTLQIGVPQKGAHNEAVQRELKLREQRPNLQDSGRAGDQLIRDPHN